MSSPETSTETKPTAEGLLGALRADGLRITLARRAICGILADSGEDHLSAADIYTRCLEATGGIDRSTVYRTLDELARLGFLHHVHMGHHAGVYHLSARADHHHLVCEHCGTTTEVPLERLASSFSTLQAEYDFVPNGLHFAILGECGTCRNGPERR